MDDMLFALVRRCFVVHGLCAIVPSNVGDGGQAGDGHSFVHINSPGRPQGCGGGDMMTRGCAETGDGPQQFMVRSHDQSPALARLRMSFSNAVTSS